MKKLEAFCLLLFSFPIQFYNKYIDPFSLYNLCVCGFSSTNSFIILWMFILLDSVIRKIFIELCEKLTMNRDRSEDER